MEIKTTELIGPALDWAVAKIEGWELKTGPSNWFGTKPWLEKRDEDGTSRRQLWELRYSTNWAQGGPIIFQEKIGLREPSDATRADGTLIMKVDLWYARINGENCVFIQSGTHPLIAAMRCFVASKLGDEVEVPDELT